MMLCVGGVCVPYTAVVPILILGFKWFAGKLASWGLLPKSIQNLLQIHATSPPGGDENSKEKSTEQCCNSSSSTATPATAASTGPSLVQELESEEMFPKVVNESDKVVCKFTAR